MTTFYTLADYNKAALAMPAYTLPTEILDIISGLTAKLGVQAVAPIAAAKRGGAPLKPDPKFKATVIAKEGSMTDVRMCLNKISAKNYDTARDQIIRHLQTVDEIQTIANNLFDIASTNKFYSEIYARLYKDLTDSFPVFHEILTGFIANFRNRVGEIQYVDPNKSYDEFCAYNKKNDARKATAVFIVNLVKQNVLSKDLLLDLVQDIQGHIRSGISTENKTNEVEEMSEIEYLMLANGWAVIADVGDGVREFVREVSQMKPKEHASLSSRAAFKHLDLLEKVIQ
jgi:hypothetical protein